MSIYFESPSSFLPFLDLTLSLSLSLRFNQRWALNPSTRSPILWSKDSSLDMHVNCAMNFRRNDSTRSAVTDESDEIIVINGPSRPSRLLEEKRWPPCGMIRNKSGKDPNSSLNLYWDDTHDFEFLSNQTPSRAILSGGNYVKESPIWSTNASTVNTQLQDPSWLKVLVPPLNCHASNWSSYCYSSFSLSSYYQAQDVRWFELNPYYNSLFFLSSLSGIIS